MAILLKVNKGTNYFLLAYWLTKDAKICHVLKAANKEHIVLL